MSSEIINQTGYIPQMPICEKSSSVEVNSDFSLPDYQPEIRRLLSTRVNVLPPSEYIGNDSAEFSGEIIYRILYIGSDGALYSASLSDNYTFSAPLEYTSKNTSPDEISVATSSRPESVLTRVLAPRKLNIRCKLRSDIEVLSPALCSPRISGNVSEESIQNLVASCPARQIKKIASEPISLSDFISLESPTESARIVDCVSNVFITECSSSQEKINCKGEVWLKILYCNESESDQPLVISRKVPFSCALDNNDIDNSFECRSNAFVSEEKFEIEENGINCEFFVTVYAEAQKNDSVSYIKDSYSTERTCESTYQSITVPTAIKCMNGNLTQSETLKLSDIKLSPDAKIIDINGTASANELVIDSGKMILKGECAYLAVYCMNDEYSTLEFTLPFKYEMDSRSIATALDIKPSWNANISVVSSRARCDDEKLFLDSELALSLRMGGSKTVEMLSEISFGEEIEKHKSEIVVCYPEKSDTLWSIAKHYAEKSDKIRLQNAISETDQALKKKYLII